MTGAPPEPREAGPTRSTPLLSVAAKVLGGLATLLILVLVVGFALPGTWEARRSVTIQAPADSVFGFLDVLERWDAWSPWPEVALVRSGPPRGEGATMSWDDPYVGDGSFRIAESRAPDRLRYKVEVEGGAMVIVGRFELAGAEGGTRLTWTEAGDFGWNPLMGYAALRMDRVQGEELERAMGRLKTLVETGTLPSEPAG